MRALYPARVGVPLFQSDQDPCRSGIPLFSSSTASQSRHSAYLSMSLSSFFPSTRSSSSCPWLISSSIASSCCQEHRISAVERKILRGVSVEINILRGVSIEAAVAVVVVVGVDRPPQPRTRRGLMDWYLQAIHKTTPHVRASHSSCNSISIKNVPGTSSEMSHGRLPAYSDKGPQQ